MRTKTVIATICAAAISVAAMPASAYQEQGNLAAKEKKAEQQKKKICKWLPELGSKRVERHCLTAEEWKKAEALSW